MKFLTTRDLATRWKCSVSWVDHAADFQLPPRLVIPGSRRRLWREVDVENWEAEKVAGATDPARGRGRPAKAAIG